MSSNVTRRDILGMATAGCGIAAVFGIGGSRALGVRGKSSSGKGPDDGFPRQSLDAVEEVVSLSHFNLPAIKKIVEARPALAKASWDWGFGDWETAIGAASHTGRREIVEVLMKHGARPTLFTFAMLGNLPAVRAMIEAHPGIQRTPGPHGIPLMRHAQVGGSKASAVVEYLNLIGDADLTGPDLPIPADEKKRIMGVYAFGGSAEDHIEIFDKRGELRITRGDRVGRRLVRTGTLQYHPSGAPAVFVRFVETASTVSALTIEDARLTVNCKRRTGSKG